MQLHEARHQANVNAKARRLFHLGYTGAWHSEDEVEIISPTGAVYRVNPLEQTCQCSHFQEHGFCSHVWGWHIVMRGMAEQGACIRERGE
jgi:hypothetical protein